MAGAVSAHEELEFSPPTDITTNFTSQISDLKKLGTPWKSGAFGEVFQCIVETSNGRVKAAVKVFKIDPSRATEKIEKAILRELRVWLRLKHPTIVPLLGIAYVNSIFKIPALVSQWMPSGTLCIYLKQATTITISTKVALAKAVAAGLDYLHSEKVVHGDLHPANVLIDDLGKPCLTDFGLATVEGEAELQLNSTTAERSFNSRWRAPEVIGIESDPESTTSMSDIYSFGSVMFFIVSGDMPWKHKNSPQICIALSKRTTPTRPHNVLDDHWNLVQDCWSWDPGHRPGATKILERIDHFRINNSRDQEPKNPSQGLMDLTGQISGTNFVAGGAFGNVYKCEWIQPSGPVKVVAVKAFPFCTSEEDLIIFRQKSAIWTRLIHDNIVTLCGTTEGFGPSIALVSPWFPEGTLHRLIAEQGLRLSIRSKLKMLHDIASGLHYLHSVPVVHGDVTSFNVLVDIKEGKYGACLTDFGLSNVLGEIIGGGYLVRGSGVRPGAIRWTAPELLRCLSGVKLTAQNDMYSFGRIMFHVLALVVPWHDINDYDVLQRILRGEDISRPDEFDARYGITNARWNHIEQCWSAGASARPSALMAMDFLKSELEVLIDDDTLIGDVPISHQSTSLDTYDADLTTVSDHTIRSTPHLMGLQSQDQHHDATVRATSTSASTLIESISGPLNVLVFGETGVGKSSVINLILGQDIVETSPDAEVCTIEHTSYDICLKDRQFKIWEVSSLRSMGFFRTLSLESRLKKPITNLHKSNGGIHLLLYCIRASKAQKALVGEYTNVTNAVGSIAGCISVAAVVNCLEGYPRNMDDWWVANNENLGDLGMQFSGYACVTSLPEDPSASRDMRIRRLQSQQAIRSLICESVGSSPPAPIMSKDGQA